eukprot:TRINITY_DN22321_c0_g1_i1.p1 TRINITY_DN22321_c0_g1~~TRINITY_DN22321_c0_g1_i1.p1  ORF type:complete len:464 (-),score=80.17 TRINITY_DN22321_c0_g1_i1:191-1582(-)
MSNDNEFPTETNRKIVDRIRKRKLNVMDREERWQSRFIKPFRELMTFVDFSHKIKELRHQRMDEIPDNVQTEEIFDLKEPITTEERKLTHPYLLEYINESLFDGNNRASDKMRKFSGDIDTKRLRSMPNINKAINTLNMNSGMLEDDYFFRKIDTLVNDEVTSYRKNPAKSTRLRTRNLRPSLLGQKGYISPESEIRPRAVSESDRLMSELRSFRAQSKIIFDEIKQKKKAVMTGTWHGDRGKISVSDRHFKRKFGLLQENQKIKNEKDKMMLYNKIKKDFGAFSPSKKPISKARSRLFTSDSPREELHEFFLTGYQPTTTMSSRGSDAIKFRRSSFVKERNQVPMEAFKIRINALLGELDEVQADNKLMRKQMNEPARATEEFQNLQSRARNEEQKDSLPEFIEFSKPKKKIGFNLIKQNKRLGVIHIALTNNFASPTLPSPNAQTVPRRSKNNFLLKEWEV